MLDAVVVSDGESPTLKVMRCCVEKPGSTFHKSLDSAQQQAGTYQQYQRERHLDNHQSALTTSWAPVEPRSPALSEPADRCTSP